MGDRGAEFLEDGLARRRVDVDEGNSHPSPFVPSHLPFGDVDFPLPEKGSHFPDDARNVPVGKDEGRPGGKGVDPVVVQEDDPGNLVEEQRRRSGGFLWWRPRGKGSRWNNPAPAGCRVWAT